MTKASPNGEEAQNKDESQKDKLNKPKGVEAVTNEVTIGGPKLMSQERKPTSIHW